MAVFPLAANTYFLRASSVFVRYCMLCKLRTDEIVSNRSWPHVLLAVEHVLGKLVHTSTSQAGFCFFKQSGPLWVDHVF